MVVDFAAEAAKLRKELDQLKMKVEEEEQQRTEAQAQADKKEGDLRKSIETLLGKLLWLPLFLFPCQIALSYNVNLHIVSAAADIPVDCTNRLQVDSMSDALSFAVDSSDQIQELLQNTKGALAKLFALIFPKLD
jgi:hypothetical protein